MHKPSGLGEIEDPNERALCALEALVRANSVVPFVGAGMSIPSGMPSWQKFLTDVSGLWSQETKPPTRASWDQAETSIRRPPGSAEISDLIAKGDFEGAAQKLHDFSPVLLVDEIRKRYEIDRPKEFGPVAWLPLLTDGPVLTTNFDYVLESAFAALDKPFVTVLWGGRAEHMVRAVAERHHYLFKLHGDAKDTSDRVLTTEEFVAAYGRFPLPESEKAWPPLLKALTSVFTGASVLFLGCSLGNDRILSVLRELKSRKPMGTHFAFVEAIPDADARQARTRSLVEAGVQPIWVHNFTSELPDLIKRLIRARQPSWVPQPFGAKGSRRYWITADARRDDDFAILLDLIASARRVRVFMSPEGTWPRMPAELKRVLDALLEFSRRGGTYERVVQIPDGDSFDAYHEVYREHFAAMLAPSSNARLFRRPYSRLTTFLIVDDAHVAVQQNGVRLEEGMARQRFETVEIDVNNAEKAAWYANEFDAILSDGETQRVRTADALVPRAPGAVNAREIQRRRRAFGDYFMDAATKSVMPERGGGALLEALRCTEHAVSIIGINALHPVHGGFGALRAILRGNGVVRVLMLQRNSAEFLRREEAEGAAGSGRLRVEWLATLANLGELDRQRGGHGSLQIRCYSEQPRVSLVIIDDWLAIENPYLDLDAKAPQGFASHAAFWLNDARHDAAAGFARGVAFFEQLWERSEKAQVAPGLFFEPQFRREVSRPTGLPPPRPGAIRPPRRKRP